MCVLFRLFHQQQHQQQHQRSHFRAKSDLHTTEYKPTTRHIGTYIDMPVSKIAQKKYNNVFYK